APSARPPVQEEAENWEARSALLSSDTLSSLKRRIHARYIKEADVAAAGKLSRIALADEIRALTTTMLTEEGIALTTQLRQTLVDAVVSEIAGLGPLEALLA